MTDETTNEGALRMREGQPGNDRWIVEMSIGGEWCPISIGTRAEVHQAMLGIAAEHRRAAEVERAAAKVANGFASKLDGEWLLDYMHSSDRGVMKARDEKGRPFLTNGHWLVWCTEFEFAHGKRREVNTNRGPLPMESPDDEWCDLPEPSGEHPDGRGCTRTAVGLAWIDDKYIKLLRALGVSRVQWRVDAIGSMVFAPGVAVIMGVRV